MNASQTEKATAWFFALAAALGLILSLVWGGWTSLVGGLVAWAFCILLVAIGLFFAGIAASPLIALVVAIIAARPPRTQP